MIFMLSLRMPTLQCTFPPDPCIISIPDTLFLNCFKLKLTPEAYGLETQFRYFAKLKQVVTLLDIKYLISSLVKMGVISTKDAN